MKDKYNNDNKNSSSPNEADEFLKKFDEIKKNFKENDSSSPYRKKQPKRASFKNTTSTEDPAVNLEKFPLGDDGIISNKLDEGIDEKTKSSSINKNKRKKQKKGKSKLKKFFLAFLVLCVIIFGAVGVWAMSIIKDTPPIIADDIYSLLSENSVIYDDEGKELENLFYSGQGLRTNLDYKDMPEDLVNAFIAIEDKTFWTHHGFNVVRIFGAIIDGLTSGDSIKGTSTITQQLARNLYLVDTKDLRSMKRKVQEAYYALQLERQLSKEEIIEAYLNTIYLGSGANGVQAASQTYFSKDVGELTLAESAVIASIPKHPNKNSPIRKLENEDIENPEALDYIYRGETYSIWYQDDYKDRQETVLAFMKEQGKISDEEYQEAMAQDIREAINPDQIENQDISSYFADYVIRDVIRGLMAEYEMDEAEATDMIYNGGLHIHSTININMQKIIEGEYEKNNNFPRVTSRLNKDSYGNIRDSNNRILLYHYKNMIDGDGNFLLRNDEYQKNDDGSITIFKGNRLNIYKTEVNNKIDYSVELKGMYLMEDGLFHTISSGFILIPSEYKSRDNEENLVISKEFIQGDSPLSLTENGLLIPSTSLQLKEKVIQPQSAMVIVDYKTGSIKAMAGGRNITGKQLFNRATATRQPGSAIKPIGVYGPALQRSVDMVNNNTLGSGKTVWTAASAIDDAPYTHNGKLWPKNWYTGYRGIHTLRESVEQSVNVNAVKVLNDIGPDASLSFLKKVGVTSVVESGSTNDMNPAALALGGMTNGISPLQMAGAYGAFANQGKYIRPISYSSVSNKRGEELLVNEIHETVAMDRGVAFIMTDILRTTVSNGIAKEASIGTHIVAGKTGTTSDNYDAWFVGMTPHYVASLWIGNDINLELTQGSVAASRLWSRIMRQVHSGLPQGSFPKADNVVSAQIDTKSGKRPSGLSSQDPRGTVRTEYFVSGTVPSSTDDIHISIDICTASDCLATEFCPEVHSRVMTRRPEGSVLSYGGFTVGDIAYEAPTQFCPIHDANFLPPEGDEDNELPPWLDGGENGDDEEGGGPGDNSSNGNSSND